jgi:hypothetical protein
MCNRQIVQRLTLRSKCAPNSSPLQFGLRQGITDILVGHALGEYAPWWNQFQNLPFPPSNLAVRQQAAALALDRIQVCSLYRHYPLAEDAHLLGDGLRMLQFGGGARQLTPLFSLDGWPDWLINLLYLIALSRRDWAYVALHGGRSAGPDWRQQLNDHWFGQPGNLPAVHQAASSLEEVAGQLGAAFNKQLLPAQPGDQLVNAVAHPLLQQALVPDLVTAVPHWLNNIPAWAPTAYHALGQGLNGLRQRLDRQGNPTQALLGLLANSALPFWGDPATAVALAGWVAALPGAGPPTTRAPHQVLAAILEAAPSLAGGPDAVFTRDDLQACLNAQFAQQPLYAQVLQGLFVGQTIDALCSTLGGLLTAPAAVPGHWVAQAIQRAAAWGPWLAVYPGLLANPPTYFLLYYQEEWSAASRASIPDFPAAQEALQAWPPPDWPLPAGHDWLVNLLLVCCLTDITRAMHACYEQQNG